VGVADIAGQLIAHCLAPLRTPGRDMSEPCRVFSSRPQPELGCGWRWQVLLPFFVFVVSSIAVLHDVT
jgi:hypothetical protein